MADSQNVQLESEQVTSITPATKPAKNTKRGAAGKATAEKNETSSRRTEKKGS